MSIIDPNETLRRIRQLTVEARGDDGNEQPWDLSGDAEELLELIENLDLYLCRGGSLPRPWDRQK